MKKSRFTEEQIAFALKQAETGTPVAEVLRRMGISEQTFYRWKKLYGGLGHGRAAPAEAARGREPQAQAARGRSQPRQAHPAGRARKKALTPARRRDLVHQVQEAHGVSERRSCVALGVGRSSDPVPLDQARSGTAADAHLRSRQEPGALRLLPDLHPAAPGGLAGEPQAGPPALSGGRLEPAAEAAAPARQRRRTVSVSLPRSGRTSAGRWTSSPTRCSTAAGCGP